jgi:hypothetical protein
MGPGRFENAQFLVRLVLGRRKARSEIVTFLRHLRREAGEPARVGQLPANGWRMVAAILFGSVALAAIAILFYTKVRPEPAQGVSTGWSVELAEFWGPFLNTPRSPADRGGQSAFPAI